MELHLVAVFSDLLVQLVGLRDHPGMLVVSGYGAVALPSSLRGECSLTGKQHAVLTDTVNGVARTRLAQAYPPALARKLAEWLFRSQELKVYNRLVQSCCGPDR